MPESKFYSQFRPLFSYAYEFWRIFIGSINKRIVMYLAPILNLK